MAKSITYQNYVIHINDNGIVTLSKDGVLFRNQAAGSRELASVLNLDVEPDCRRKKLNRLIIKEIARLNGIEEPVICDEDDEEETQEIQNNKNDDVKQTATASQSAAYYQRQCQAMYDEDSESVWNNIIPENAEEMLGALMFCKTHKDNSWRKHLVVKTSKRLIELCGLYYANNSEINRILPSVKQIVENYENTEAKDKKKKEAKQKRKKIFIWIWVVLAVLLIVVQAILWGYWAILSGAATLIVFGGVLFLCYEFIWL